MLRPIHVIEALKAVTITRKDSECYAELVETAKAKLARWEEEAGQRKAENPRYFAKDEAAAKELFKPWRREAGI